MKLLHSILFIILNILASSIGHAIGCRSRPQPARRRVSYDRPRSQKTQCQSACVNRAGTQTVPIHPEPQTQRAGCCASSSTHYPYKDPMAKVTVIMNQPRDGTNRIGPL